MRTLTLSLMLVFLAACSENTESPASSQARISQAPNSQTPIDTAEAIAAESARLNNWLDARFAEELDFSPQWKTQLGDKSDYDRLDDVSDAAFERELTWRRNSVAQMQAEFDYELLSAAAKISWDTWVYSLQRAERSAPFRRHAYIFGRGGPHAALPNFMINYHKVDDANDMQAYIARLNQIDEVLLTYLDRARRAVEDGIRSPRFNYDFAMAEIERVTAGYPFTESAGPDEASPLWQDVEAKLDALLANERISAEQAAALRTAARTAMLEQMQPAYLAIHQWLQEDRPNTSEQANGVWALPDGGDYYTTRLALMTTLDISADEIHQTGLAEVARLREEMEAIKTAVGFQGSLADFFVFMREDEQFYFPNTDAGRQAYLDLANEFLAGVATKLPEYFGILPKAELEVRRVEAFREQDGAAQHYARGTPDGSRPGVFYAHLSDMRAMPRYQLENISYHEGNPGHHMQISIQQELTDIPRFRTQYGYTAFSEGWGLYAEALGKDMGFYQDPYSDFGRLAGEIWRAIRLVVDTGIHAKQWTEEQAVRYFLENSPQPEAAIRSEIQRYITNPGQATAYKIGMLKIQELRAGAEATLGARFDIRGFHDTVLGGGALPLPVLEARVQRWVESVAEAAVN
ncbi:MAG: DUF885 domain-containing protein [Pseudomonadales bacterium]|nr:DUF885 domain-containing protein [Pseudomonadales bacterium]